MKKILVTVFCLATMAGYSQCTFGPAQWINAYYEYKALRTRYIFQLPRSLVGSSCRDTAFMYYNPNDSSIHWWTGANDLTYLAANGLSKIAADTFILGGIIDRFTKLDDSAASKILFFKTRPVAGAVFNKNAVPRFFIGEDTTVPTAVNSNFGNDSHANFSSPLVVDRVNTNTNHFNTVPFMTMTSGDGTQMNGFFFWNSTFQQGKYEPRLYTFNNQDSAIQQHGMTFTAYEKVSPANTISPSTAFSFQYEDLDSFSVNNAFGSIVRNANVFAFETGNLHPLILDRFFHMRLGDPGDMANITAKAQYELVQDTAVYAIQQSGSASLNVFESPLLVGGVYPATKTATAELEVKSTTKGLLPPRMTTTQKLAISSPAEGLQVYDLTLHQMSYFNGTVWVNF